MTEINLGTSATVRLGLRFPLPSREGTLLTHFSRTKLPIFRILLLMMCDNRLFTINILLNAKRIPIIRGKGEAFKVARLDFLGSIPPRFEVYHVGINKLR